MLDFKIDWEEDTNGITDPVIRATWARLEVHSGGRVVTQFWSKLAQGVRPGVYVSVFPLARWAIRCWWNLLSEGLAGPEALDGARNCNINRLRPWLERHNLLFGREGMAFPDLSIYRDDDDVRVRWVPDPEDVATPGRFIEGGWGKATVKEAEAALVKLVESVLLRIQGIEDVLVEEFKADWKAVSESSSDERKLCTRLATLGLDPYDPDSERFVEMVSTLEFEEKLTRDLLTVASSNPESLGADLATVSRLKAEVPDVAGDVHESPAFSRDASASDIPYRVGYARAARIRDYLGLSEQVPLSDLDRVIEDTLGPVSTKWITAERHGIDGLVHVNGVRALAAAKRSPRDSRFLMARALHHWAFTMSETSPTRLLTRANDSQQAASRAFAAELLAPATALQARVGLGANWDDHQGLVDEFDVSPMVIGYQLQNHARNG